MCCILLLALLTRLWGLDYHSLWFDESVSMTWARSAPEYAWESTFHLVKDKHPPAYYLLLHYWRELFKPFGLENNDIALRLLGSLLGVLTVAGHPAAGAAAERAAPRRCWPAHSSR